MQIEAEPKSEYMLIRMSGVVPSGTFKEHLVRLMEILQKSDLKRVLLDERDLVLEIDMHEAYQVGESEEIAMAAREGYRFASVPDPCNRSRNKTFETVMLNRSVNYRVFDSVLEAVEWLLA